jgi:hypothetical protein
MKNVIKELSKLSVARLLISRIIKFLNIGSYEFKIAFNATKQRNHYAYCIFNAAKLAKSLGLLKMSVIEFGCAAGKGLIAIEGIVKEVEKVFGIKIEVYGFDTGKGLPEPFDYKDLKYHWKKGFYKMNKESLEHKLKISKVILGDVKDTVPNFFDKYNPAPVGCVFHDLDYYSSTKKSFLIFNEDNINFLPRVYNYFDDIIGSEIELYNDWTGERLAIKEFNEEKKKIKFSPAFHLVTRQIQHSWYHQIQILHFFDHPNYETFISDTNQN